MSQPTSHDAELELIEVLAARLHIDAETRPWRSLSPADRDPWRVLAEIVLCPEVQLPFPGSAPASTTPSPR